MINHGEIISVYLPIILSLVVLEGLLSIDNAMIIAAMVDHLPERQKRLALLAGLAGAYLFRGLMILFAAILITFEWLKILGACYLLYLMIEHFGNRYHEEENKEAHGKRHGFWGTVLMVELTDLAFSIDNVIAAVALSPNLWVVITGVFIGIAAMRLLANYCIELMKSYPVLHSVAYILVGFVGLQLIVQEMTDHHLPSVAKLVVISAIAAFCICYERNALLQFVLKPILKKLCFLMFLLNKLISYPINLLQLALGIKKPVPVPIAVPEDNAEAELR